MDAIIDPKIQEIMAKLNNTNMVVAVEESKPKKKEFHPPQTYEEFLAIEKLDTWPIRITSESLLDLSDDRERLGSQSYFQKKLREGTKLDSSVLNNLESKLQDFEKNLNALADKLVVDPVCLEEEGNHIPLSIDKVFLTEMADKDSVKVHPSRRRKKKDFRDTVMETKRRSVDCCAFPGFHKSELTELPSQLEAPPLLNRVTKAQTFNAGFEKFWTKIFQSEASVAIMQDTFWWFFIEHFEKKHRKDQSRFFDRIADSFVALFTSVNAEIKDKVFSVYADCLAQVLYLAYREAFPESERYFNDDFKQMLVNLTFEWISGSRPPAGSWATWNQDQLQPRRQKAAESGTTPVAQSILDMAILQKDVDQTLELDDFHQMVNNLGAEENEDQPKLTSQHEGKDTDKSRRRKETRESCQVGPGPELERVMFNIKGRSPLVAHFLRMRQLTDRKQEGLKVRRTQVAKLQPPGPTYRQVIQDSLTMQDTLSKEYETICGTINKEISKIDRQQKEATRKIEQLQKEILFCRSSSDVKKIKARILDGEASSSPRTVTFQDVSDRKSSAD